jgi:MFS family permease
VEAWIYLVFWFESVRIRTPIGASIDVLPIVISTALSAATAGVALKKWGRFKYVVSFGWVFATFGTGLLCFLSPDSNTGRQIGFQFVQGIGLGILFPALQLACQAPQSKQDVGMAVAIFAFLRSVGDTFGVALGGIIFQNQFDVMISMETGNLPPEFMISGADATGFVAMLPAVPAPFQMVLRYVYANSLRGIWVIITALTGIGLLTSFLSKDLMLDQKDNVDQESEDIRDYIEIS